jgi:hypothetical protein
MARALVVFRNNEDRAPVGQAAAEASHPRSKRVVAEVSVEPRKPRQRRSDRAHEGDFPPEFADLKLQLQQDHGTDLTPRSRRWSKLRTG